MTVDIAIVVVMLALQPLLALLYLYVAVRAVISFGSRESGRWVDDRIEKAREAAEELR